MIERKEGRNEGRKEGRKEGRHMWRHMWKGAQTNEVKHPGTECRRNAEGGRDKPSEVERAGDEGWDSEHLKHEKVTMRCLLQGNSRTCKTA